MTPQPSFRLDGRIGWRIAGSTGIAVARDGITLAPLPGAARPLTSAAGDFGGHALPTRVAAGPGGLLYLLDSAGAILVYDPCRESFAPIACLQGPGRLPGLGRPIALAVHPSGRLLVLDGDARMVTAIALVDGHVLRQWKPFVVHDGELRSVPVVAGVDPLTGAPDGSIVLPAGAWDPIDIAVLADGRTIVSDRSAGVLWVFDRNGCPIGSWNGAHDNVVPLDKPTALAAAADGRIFVVEEGRSSIAVLDHHGHIIERTSDDTTLPAMIDGGSLAVDADGTLWISNRMPGPAMVMRCDVAGRCCAADWARLLPADCVLLAFDSEGHAILGSAREPCLRRAQITARHEQGQIAFAALDSGRTGTVWDRIRFDLDAPMGTLVTVRTFTSDATLGDADVAALGAGAWASTTLSGSGQPVAMAIRSAPGRYLWLRIELAGDGAQTPLLRGMTIAWPRRTSARYLPATWSAEPASADFLARFLAIFDELRAQTLAPIDAMPALFDPIATPAANQGAPGEDFLDWLAGWIGIVLDRNWPVDRRRRLVAEAPSLFRIRGTLKGLARHIAIYTGIEPKIVEHFRLRRWLTLDEARLDGTQKLWGPDIVRRLQLDGYAEIGRFALVDGGDPVTDPIAAFAHRATVYVPVGEAFGDADLAALEDVVEAAKPAHVEVEVRLMRPRFVLGCELLLGVNTIIGHDTRVAQTDDSVLGEDIRLAGPPSGFTLRQGMRLGSDTTLG